MTAIEAATLNNNASSNNNNNTQNINKDEEIILYCDTELPHSNITNNPNTGNNPESEQSDYDNNNANNMSEINSEKSKSEVFMKYASFISLIIAVLGMSSAGPAFLYLERKGIAPITCAVWRMCAQLMFLSIPTIIEIKRLKPRERDWNYLRVQDEDTNDNTATVAPYSPSSDNNAIEMDNMNNDNNNGSSNHSSSGKKSIHAIWYLIGVSLMWGISLALWVVALEYTTTARASLFGSLYPLLLVAYYRFKGVRISCGEVIGVVLAISGIACSELLDSFYGQKDSDTDKNDYSNALYGDLLCLLGSFLLAAEVEWAAKARKVVPLFTYSFAITVGAQITIAIGAIWLEKAEFSMHPQYGLFGWLNNGTYILVYVLLFGFIVGMIGTLGFNFSVAYVNPVLFSTIQLLDPGLTGLISWIAQLESFPSLSTLLGILIVSTGIGFVVIFENKRKQAEAQKQYINSNTNINTPKAKSSNSKRMHNGNKANKTFQYAEVSLNNNDDF